MEKGSVPALFFICSDLLCPTHFKHFKHFKIVPVVISRRRNFKCLNIVA
uniref:Uncharacterized protein n=1 Tax=Rhizophora mucronata TaxID=61149 RepID=A0A2P2NA93_RHIMU